MRILLFLFRKFIGEELRLPGAEKIALPRSHRMGHAHRDNNRMMTAKVINESDQRSILTNAKTLAGRGYVITKQIPAEVDERHQFAWDEFKSARTAKKYSHFDGAKLMIDNEHIAKYDPVALPACSSSSAKGPIVVSDILSAGDHSFQAYAIQAKSTQDIRNGLDEILMNESIAHADHLPYAFRVSEPEQCENF